MIKLKMPKAKWPVILTCLAVIVCNTAFTEPTWKESPASTSSSKPAAGAVNSELEALLNDGGPNSEWGLDFHTFGGQDDTYFLTGMTAWLKAHHAIGLYWVGGHVTSSGWPGGPLVANQGAAAQDNIPGEVNGMGNLLGGHLQYAGVYLSDQETISDAMTQPILAPWEDAGYQLVLSVDIIPNPPIIKSYSGPPEPRKKPYQISSYPDAVTALKQGLG